MAFVGLAVIDPEMWLNDPPDIRAKYGALYLHALVVLMFFNVVDLLISALVAGVIALSV